MIDIIIPTIWACDLLPALKEYQNNHRISKIIVIDNNPSMRQECNFSKVQIYSQNRNIFVNPSWNEGIRLSRSKYVAIVNDDIIVKEQAWALLDMHEFTKDDIVGVDLRGYQDNYRIDDIVGMGENIQKLDYDKMVPIGMQAWAFGIFMFMRKEAYVSIPDLYQVWFGDDWLCQHKKNIFVMHTEGIKGTISETIKKRIPEVHLRILKDIHNMKKFGSMPCKHLLPGIKLDI